MPWRCTRSQRYQEAINAFHERHMCTLRLWPKPVWASMEKDSTLHLTMNGPSEFHTTGSLLDCTVIEDAHKFNVPTFQSADALTKRQVIRPFFKEIPRVRWMRLESFLNQIVVAVVINGPYLRFCTRSHISTSRERKVNEYLLNNSHYRRNTCSLPLPGKTRSTMMHLSTDSLASAVYFSHLPHNSLRPAVDVRFGLVLFAKIPE
ncbi:hypothetical protein DFJ43DRAFT_369981 [Lentinula guzmanii]|uniref:Uncharacterized protein n=1 Tax=Lentinula guzmanii TaxID=2804957 RepID=A0AA38J8P2_9AGAR|nr:hypothetical protein DFJ43DRAFT_369981 [Lentinula guzmanii]